MAKVFLLAYQLVWVWLVQSLYVHVGTTNMKLIILMLAKQELNRAHIPHKESALIRFYH